MSVEQGMPHPPAPELEAFAAGDKSASIAVHLKACEPCAAYVSQLRKEAEGFRATADPAAFADAIRRRSATLETRGKAKIVWFVGPAVAAAAVVVLSLRAPSRVEPVSTLATSAPSSTPPSDIARFKGALSIAVIRERGGRQERLTGPFEVQPSDRIRIEISVDREAQVTAGLLSDDGTWIPLQSPVAVSVGTHYSDVSARFDDNPTDAVLLVGSPIEVDRARKARNFEGIVAWRVTSAPAR